MECYSLFAYLFVLHNACHTSLQASHTPDVANTCDMNMNPLFGARLCDWCITSRQWSQSSRKLYFIRKHCSTHENWIKLLESVWWERACPLMAWFKSMAHSLYTRYPSIHPIHPIHCGSADRVKQIHWVLVALQTYGR